MAAIRPRDRDAIIQSLRAGVVPRAGQHLIQVGRSRELETLIRDIDSIAQGGTSFRLVIGEYGSGKTFFLNLVRAVAMEKKLVVTTADMNPDRRLHATGGQARSLYAELAKEYRDSNTSGGWCTSGSYREICVYRCERSQGEGLLAGSRYPKEARASVRAGERIRLRVRRRELLEGFREWQRDAQSRCHPLVAW